MHSLAYILRFVAPRKGRVSRNAEPAADLEHLDVAPRKGRVSRNPSYAGSDRQFHRRAPQGACE